MRNPAAALKSIKNAVKAQAWRADPHLWKQMSKRGLQLIDVLEAIRKATRIRPHDMQPLNVGGESWRVYGYDYDERYLGVGVELVEDKSGNFVVIITAFIQEGSR
jgi:hypothetical protein